VGWLSRDDFPSRRGHAGPALPTPEAQMLGEWSFDYAIMPHDGAWHDADALVPRTAEAFANPVRALLTDLHAGTLPTAWSFVQLEPPVLRLSTVKRAEDGQDIIIRWYNPMEEEVIAELATAVPFAGAAHVSLNERFSRDLSDNRAAPQQHWRVPTPAGGIITLRLSQPSPNRLLD